MLFQMSFIKIQCDSTSRGKQKNEIKLTFLIWLNFFYYLDLLLLINKCWSLYDIKLLMSLLMINNNSLLKPTCFLTNKCQYDLSLFVDLYHSIDIPPFKERETVVFYLSDKATQGGSEKSCFCLYCWKSRCF